MNVYDKVHELAKALKDSDEFKQLKITKEKIDKENTSKKMIEDFRKLQIEAYSEQVEKGELSDATKQKLQNLGSVISLNPECANYLQAEARFGVLWEDIMKILSEAVDEGMVKHK